jgi:hypothetical protein
LSFDYVNADYSSSTLGDLFPATVMTGFEYVDPLLMNDPTLFGDGDHFGGFFVEAFGSWSLGPSNFGSSEDPTGKRAHCSSDGSTVSVESCEREEDLSSLIATSPGAGSDAGYQPAGWYLPGSNSPFGGGTNQDFGFQMIAAQSSFAMTWPSGVIQGAFPPACCDVTSPVDGSFAPASDFESPGVSLNSVSPQVSPAGGSFVSIGGAPGTVPEIPPIAMLLIGFAGLGLIGSGRLSRSDRLG